MTGLRSCRQITVCLAVMTVLCARLGHTQPAGLPDDGAHELYDLSRDPAESRNVIGQFPAQAEAMEAELHRQLRALQPVGSPSPPLVKLLGSRDGVAQAMQFHRPRAGLNCETWIVTIVEAKRKTRWRG